MVSAAASRTDSYPDTCSSPIIPGDGINPKGPAGPRAEIRFLALTMRNAKFPLPDPAGNGPPSLLAAFRGGPPARLPLESAEKTLLTILIIHLCLLPWAVGGGPIWARSASLTLALAGMVAAVWPRASESDGDPAGKFSPLQRLLRFPCFWFGLALVGYVAIQALNPKYVYGVADGIWKPIPKRNEPTKPTQSMDPHSSVGQRLRHGCCRPSQNL